MSLPKLLSVVTFYFGSEYCAYNSIDAVILVIGLEWYRLHFKHLKRNLSRVFNVFDADNLI